VVVWDAGSGPIRGYGSCPDPDVLEWVSEVAIAGSNVAWLDVYVADAIDRTIYRASPTVKTNFDLPVEAPLGGGGEPGGDYVGHLHGSGSLMVYNAWAQCYPDGADVGSDSSEWCRKGKRTATGIRLMRLTGAGSRARAIGSGPGVSPVLWVGSGRIVVRSAANGVAILRPDGSVAQRIDLPGRTILTAALDGSELGVLEPGRLELYSAPGGRLLHSYRLSPLPSALRSLAGLGGGYAALVERTSVRLIRFADGRTARIAFPRPLGPVRAQLDSAGLFYSYNDREAPETGHVCFLPRSDFASLF
jgi:hypothetical protein